MIMNKEEKCIIIQKYFDEILPNPKCELDYNSDYGLLIAVMLSAQCTDKKVNLVTGPFFNKYTSLEEIDSLTIEEIENNIKSLGLYKNKAKNLKGIVHELLTRFNGVVPSDKNDLMSLPGVGNKTANVVRVELFKIPEFPVDTHVERLAKRFKLAEKKDDVLTVENKLKKDFPKEELTRRIEGDEKHYSMSSVLSYETSSTKSDISSPEKPQAKINMSNTNEINPYMLLMSHTIIRHVIEIDKNASNGFVSHVD